jgi:hypothetical protein
MDIDTGLSTNRLFHYTSSKDRLINILKNGFHPQFSLEKLRILKNDDLFEAFAKDLNGDSQNITDEFAIPMCCFCDIPLKLVHNHVGIYGDYSIGLTKEWGKRQLICPVIYLPDSGETRLLFEILIRNYHKNIHVIRDNRLSKQKEGKISDEMLFIDIHNFYDAIVDLSMFVKPYSGCFKKGTYENEHHKFYDEREWRYKPNRMLCKSYMTKEEYNSGGCRDELNKDMGFIDFNIADITDIIVPDSEVEEVREIIKSIQKYQDFDLEIIDSLKNKI